MKHFTTEEWIDFSNQVLSGSKRGEMETHLEQGCKRCAKTLSTWQRVRQAAAVEATYQPPDNAVRITKATFAVSPLGRGAKSKGTLAELVFDSFLRPAVEGARSVASGTRQMLYRADPYQVDVSIERKPSANRLIVTGQLQNSRQPDVPCRDVPVMISNLRGNVVQTLTNEFGEFREEIKDSGDLELVFTGTDDKPVIISLRDALGGLPGRR
jgi:hypothetical protein